MAIRFSFEAFGDQLVSRELTRFANRAMDARPAWDKIADQLMVAERNRFGTRGNGTWRPLAASTIARKGNARVLIDTGALKRSLTVRNAPGQELIITPGFMVFGTRVDYAIFHQRGGQLRGRPGHPPVRKPLGFTEQTKRTTLRTLQSFVVTGRA